MKTVFALAAAGLSLMSVIGAASAQPYGGRDYGYEERGRGYGRDDRYRERDRGYDDRDDRYRERGRGYGFNEREYLRCNPDVLQAVRRGQMESGALHYRVFGRREGRRLSC